MQDGQNGTWSQGHELTSSGAGHFPRSADFQSAVSPISNRQTREPSIALSSMESAPGMRSATLHVQPTSTPAGLLLGFTPSPARGLPNYAHQPPPGWVTEVWRISAEEGANTFRLAKVLQQIESTLPSHQGR